MEDFGDGRSSSGLLEASDGGHVSTQCSQYPREEGQRSELKPAPSSVAAAVLSSLIGSCHPGLAWP